MCNCHSILERCVMFSGVKLSTRSFNLFTDLLDMSFSLLLHLLPVLRLTSVCSVLKFCPAFLGS